MYGAFVFSTLNAMLLINVFALYIYFYLKAVTMLPRSLN